MKIVCLSDTHGNLPNIPEADLLLLGGDYCPPGCMRSVEWYMGPFKDWLSSIEIPIIGVSGNHDFVFQYMPILPRSLPWTYLQDSGTTFQNIKIWGSPWQPVFGNWAFNAEEGVLKEKWELIPNDIDILLLHGPPRGVGDYVVRDHKHTGSPSLLSKIYEIKPKLVVSGHIHGAHGRYEIEKTTLISASYVGEPTIWNKYEPTYPIEIFDF